MVKVTVWNENLHDRTNDEVKAIYPDGIHGCIAEFLKTNDFDVQIATQDQEEHGLTDEVLENTDVLIWWSHMLHHEVSDEVVEKIYNRVHKGMGLILLHSSHFAKIFKKLMGTTCDLKWREANDNERLWVIDQSHPIVDGIDDFIDLEAEEMYGEHFDIPTPDELVFISWFKGGEVFRSGVTYRRGNGKIFYFRPGHETHPTFHHPQIQRVICNAVEWAKPTARKYPAYGWQLPNEGTWVEEDK